MPKLRVLLVDDQILFAQGLRRIFEMSAKDIEVVGISMNGKEAIDDVERYRPDVVLMDVRMPVMDGVEATRKLQKKHQDLSIMMLTTFDDDNYVEKAIEYGAAGYLLKDTPPDELIASVRAIKHVSVLISPSIAHKILRRTSDFDVEDLSAEEKESIQKSLQSLSRREKEVLDLILHEYDNRLIAEKLFLGEQTVRNYVSTIYSKFDVQNRFELIRLLRHEE
jgi:DNA-binding NarL/FixJ family response regulator